MEQIEQQIAAYKQEILAFEPATAADLETYRIKFLGTKGIVKAMFGEMKQVPNDRKKEFGQVLNSFKQLAEERYAQFETLKEDASKVNNLRSALLRAA
jgi:phenylalanyl-tRNA synthetase alpha chain